MIIAIGGATASGKSALAIEIAKRFDGEIVGADSMQIYEGMDIGTAKCTKEEMCGIPHHLIDIVSPKETYNVAMYVEDAEKAISDICSRGKLPVLVGGTGLYIKSLLYNYSLGAYDENMRLELNKELAERGEDAIWEELNAVDPIAAAKIHKNNIKRVVRALEFFRLTGRSITEEEITEKKPHALFCIRTERSELYKRIDRRVDEMFSKGLKEEVERLIGDGVDFSCQSMQAIGYKEFKGYFEGIKTLEEVKEEIKLNSRHYAKRQETWFKAMETCEWVEKENLDKVFQKIEQIIIK